MNKPALIFDGNCGFCTSIAHWVRERAGDSIDVFPHQEVDIAALGLSPQDVHEQSWFVDQWGNLYGGPQSMAKVLQETGAGWSAVGGLLSTPPFTWAASAVYPLVSKNRYRLPGGSPACRLEGK